MKNEEILQKLLTAGVKMYKQQLCKIFHNPFYCGLIAHGLLDGRVVQGNQEKMISQETYFKIHRINEESTRLGVPHKKENDALPLKVFLKCADCEEPMTGYIVKKKGLYYYKCRKKGCQSNKSATVMHKLFLKELSSYAIKEGLIKAIAFELEHAYYEKNKESMEKAEELKKRYEGAKKHHR